MDKSFRLNEHHGAQIVQILRFARYKRKEVVKSVDACFDDIKVSRFSDDTTYTKDEVHEVVDTLNRLVSLEVDNELSNTSYTNLLLLQQLFIQAEMANFELQADISQLENSDLLAEMKNLEDNFFNNHSEKDMGMFVQQMKSFLHQNLPAIDTSKRIESMPPQAMKSSGDSDLEKRFYQTGAYKNLKRMLDTKNKELKDLRAKLKQYEPDS